VEDLTHFALAALALLLVPGPTNTLLAASGATVGFPRSVRLLLSEVGGYVAGIAIVRAVLVAVGTNASALTALRVVSAVYLVGLAVRLWREVPSADSSPITLRRVFVTTFLNPKVLIVGLVLMSPNSGTARVQWLIFAGLVPIVALAWIAAGSFIGTGGWPIRSAAIPRAAAIVLLGFAGTMIVSSLHG
jgi:threonine/homoserine/homoserine lactone efflux protein